MKIVKELLQQTKNIIVNLSKYKSSIYVFKKIKIPINDKIPSESYGKFVQENPKATRQERRDALKKFLDSTR